MWKLLNSLNVIEKKKQSPLCFILLTKKKSIKSSKATDFKVFLLNLSEWPVEKNYKWENLYK